MGIEPLSRSEFLKLIALGGAGLAIPGHLLKTHPLYAAIVNAKLRPDLTVIDATRILVRNGPSGGSLNDVKAKDTVIACGDWVAADTYATRLFGKKPGAVPYIAAAAKMRLGTMDLSALTVRIV